MSEEKPKFKRQARQVRGEVKPKAAIKAQERIDKLSEEKRHSEMFLLKQEHQRLNDQLMMTEWALTGARYQVFGWLQEVKGFTADQARAIVKRRPLTQWHRILEYVQTNYANNLVRRHMETAAQLNDQHLLAAKLGMAKAMEFLSKMSVEQKVDKHGRPYFAHFRTTDLKNCLESIALAQKVTRVALGLPSDEGSVHIWQKIQQTFNVNPPTAEDIQELPPEGEDLKVQVMRLQKTYSYDDIKTMIGAFRQAGLRTEPNTIDAEKGE